MLPSTIKGKYKLPEAAHKEILSDEAWAKIKPHIPERRCRRGRPRVPDRIMAEAILLRAKTQLSLRDISLMGYPPFQTISRRMEEWRVNGVLEAIIRSQAIPGAKLPEWELAPLWLPRRGEDLKLEDIDF